MSPMTTFAPSATSIRACAAPIPRAPPLISATFSSTRPMTGQATARILRTRTCSNSSAHHAYCSASVRRRNSMAIRVALIGTGNCGSIALRQLINDGRFELTGVWVSSDAKVGKDAGELAGLDGLTGVAATNDLDAILAVKPDCVVYCAMGD